MMSHYYQDEDKLYVSVDCIILGFNGKEINVLIIKRKFEPLKGERSLMGGFVRCNESLDETVMRVVADYTGVEDVYMEQVGAYGTVDRDPADRVVSIVYYALIDMQMFDEKLKKQHNAEWVNINNVGTLILDHNLFLDDTIRLLKRRTSNRPVGFNLLPEKFTLPQLQSLYEAIYQKPLDKRNFRKKILGIDILDKLNNKDKSASKKGAYYYQFNKKKYDNLLENGFNFAFI
ncbi:MAG: NUDIX domain-containing protein [Candidatus Symbiothrix sp.]|jgi:ADP-ribose pyrophosphatase YjhB (NUDIX family)|nr:NUDIX domain-containing protein [Candidatus Symbiothrix sp.]